MTFTLTPININLNHPLKYNFSKRCYRITAMIAHVLSLTCVTAVFFEPKFLWWFYAFYFFGYALVMLANSKGKTLLDYFGKSFFQMDDQGFRCKLNVLKKKTTSYNRNDISEIKVKLFEIRLLVNDRWVSISLEKLADDHLKLVKDVFRERAKLLQPEQMLQAV